MYGSRFLFFAVMVSGCCRTPECLAERYGMGGGQDIVSVHLPFDPSFTTQCVQGAGGSYSHEYASTAYDVDLDTPNDEDVPVYAPANGTAFVHDGDRNRNFGVHLNLDLGDGTYLILAHLDDILVDDESEVVAGQLVAIEGTTGMSTGDHVHIGRHEGEASRDGIYGESLEGLSFSLLDSSGVERELTTSEMTCALSGGGRYVSRLATPRWRPTGSLVKTFGASTVYIIENATMIARPFMNESAFLSRNYDFTDVAVISDEELACYADGEAVSDDSWVGATYDETGDAWLLVGAWAASDRYRMKLPDDGWQGVLKTWGIAASTYDDLESNDELGDILSHYPRQSGLAIYRDGSLVSPIEDSAVYVMSDGAAMPIDRWETLLLLGWENREVVEVDEDEFEAIVSVRGSCTIDSYCLTSEDVTTCGGPHESGEGVYSAERDDTGDVGADMQDDEPSDSPVLPVDTGVPLGTLWLTWTMPEAAVASSIALSGEFTDENGMAYGWNTDVVRTYNASSLTYGILDAGPGDSFRYSYEFTAGSTTSWSCLAPFPPGNLQGTPTAEYNGDNLSVETADDPSSDGCGLRVTIPR